jgi:thiamine biosynthesis lipoprotein ApbE
MMRGIAERLVDVPGDVRVKGDHLADGHEFSLVIATPHPMRGSNPAFVPFSVDC